MGKHAFLIIANENYTQLKQLLFLLDDERNDIVIHIDKKSPDYDEESFSSVVKQAKLSFTSKRICVDWGSFSLIECELLLLKDAVALGKHDYYHLLSGKDLPIKTQDRIHAFFEQNQGKEFIRFGKHTKDNYYFRVKYYFDFVQGLKFPLKRQGKAKVAFIALCQKLIGINRLRGNKIEFKKGTEWFSITQDLAEYVISNETWIKKNFTSTYCGDELFLQTLVYNSAFWADVFHPKFDGSCVANMRLIDWNRGRPYIFRKGDLQEILNSECLFARKFDAKVDNEIISEIIYAIQNQSTSQTEVELRQ